MRKARGLSSIVTAAVLAGAFVTCWNPTPALAQDPPSQADKNAARDAYAAGREAYGKGDFEAAYESFKKANDIIPVALARYWMAMSLDKAGRSAEALAEFDTLLGQSDVEKIGDERLATAHERRAALKAAAEAAAEDPYEGAEEPPAEEKPPPAEAGADFGFDAGAPAEEEPPPADDMPPKPYMQQLKFTDGMLEFGFLFGGLMISRAHRLLDENNFRRAYLEPMWQMGGRLAYFPIKHAGLELEIAHGEGVVRTVNTRATLLTYRAHGIVQIPNWRLTPFGMLGVGGWNASSDAMGDDSGTIVYLGAGAKLPVHDLFAIRFDFRENMAERVREGVSFSEEFLLGVSLTLFRKKDAE